MRLLEDGESSVVSSAQLLYLILLVILVMVILLVILAKPESLYFAFALAFIRSQVGFLAAEIRSRIGNPVTNHE